MYHFIKRCVVFEEARRYTQIGVSSRVAFHPFSTAHESVLGMWTQPLQARQQAPDASLTEFFVGLHGMLFANIQLDNFKRVLEHFQEKLQIGGK